MKVKYKVHFPKTTEPRSNERSSDVLPKPPSRVARLIALAHYIEGLIHHSTLKSYVEASKTLGVSRARLTQVMNLQYLSPEIQEGLLLGNLRLSERDVRSIASLLLWEDQAKLLSSRPSAPSPL